MKTNKQTLYSTSDTSMQANILLFQIFDSIYITVYNNKNRHIRFLPDTAINYSQNPYSTDSVWSYELLVFDANDMSCPNPQRYKSYSFLLKADLLE